MNLKKKQTPLKQNEKEKVSNLANSSSTINKMKKNALEENGGQGQFHQTEPNKRASSYLNLIISSAVVGRFDDSLLCFTAASTSFL